MTCQLHQGKNSNPNPLQFDINFRMFLDWFSLDCLKNHSQVFHAQREPNFIKMCSHYSVSNRTLFFRIFLQYLCNFFFEPSELWLFHDPLKCLTRDAKSPRISLNFRPRWLQEVALGLQL